MAGINDYSNTAGSNTTINGIDIAEGCSPAGINNAIRQLMADIADVDDGVVPLQTPDINGGTIDGASLGASSPITSAVISGDLTVDTNTLYVDSADNRIGIGTTDPSYMLDVKGDIRVGASQAPRVILMDVAYENSSFAIKSNNGNFSIDSVNSSGTFQASPLIIETTSSEAMRIDSSGKLGIGTSSPASKLEVEDSVNGDMHLRINNTNTGGSARTFLLLQSDGATGSLYLNGANSLSTGVNEADSMTLSSDASASNGLNINATSGSMKFYYNSSEKMRITSSGNVGIGTTSPNEILEVLKSGGGHIRLSETSARYVEITGYAEGTANGSTMAFSTIQSGTSTLTERMRIDSNGDVCINTTTPQAKLHIVRNDAGALNDANSNMIMIENTTATGMSIGSSTTGEGHIYFSDSADADVGAVSYFHTDNSLRVRVNASERMRIDSSGNVYIGTTNLDPVSANVTGTTIKAQGNIQASRDDGVVISGNRKSTDGDIFELRKNGSQVGTIGASSGYVYIQGAGTSSGLRFAPNRLNPFRAGAEADNVIDLGDASVRFDDIYATNGTIQTSDQNEKQSIQSLTASEIAVAQRISKLFKTFKFNSAVEEKGDSSRTHTGVIAQDVQQAFSDEGLDASNYALFISSTWWEKEISVDAVAPQEAVYETQTDEEGNEIQVLVQEAVEGKDAYTYIDTKEEATEGYTQRTRLGIRYPELLSFVSSAFEQRLTNIETRLTALET